MSSLPFPSIAEPLLADLAEGRCCAVVGLSNAGKSTLMRGLASDEAAARYRRLSGRPVSLVLVDGNRAVALSAQAFYEIVVRVDVDSGDVWVDGARVPLLTDLEFRLLRLLDERRGKLTDKYAIVTAVWGEAYLGEVDDARIEKLVSRLRSKIEVDPAEPRYLLTQRGRGYKLVSSVAGEGG